MPAKVWAQTQAPPAQDPWVFPHPVPSATAVCSQPPSDPHESVVQSFWSSQLAGWQPLLLLVLVDDELVVVLPVVDELVVVPLDVDEAFVVVPDEAPPEPIPSVFRKQAPGPVIRAAPTTATMAPALPAIHRLVALPRSPVIRS